MRVSILNNVFSSGSQLSLHLKLLFEVSICFCLVHSFVFLLEKKHWQETRVKAKLSGGLSQHGDSPGLYRELALVFCLVFLSLIIRFSSSRLLYVVSQILKQ